MKERSILLGTKILVGITVVSFLIGSQAFAQAEMCRGHSCQMMRGMMGGSPPLFQHTLEVAFLHAEHLGLSEEQITSLKMIKLAAAKERVHSEAEIKVVELEFADLLDRPDVDLKAVEAKLKEGEALRTAAQLKQLKFQEQARKVLTAEQWEKLKSVHTEAVMPAPSEKEQHQHGEGEKGHRDMMHEMCEH